MATTFAWQPFCNASGQGTYLLWPMLLYVQMASWSGNQVLHKTKLRIIWLSWVELRLGLILWFYPRYLWTIFLLSKYKDDWKSPSGIVFAFLQIWSYVHIFPRLIILPQYFKLFYRFKPVNQRKMYHKNVIEGGGVEPLSRLLVVSAVGSWSSVTANRYLI